MIRHAIFAAASITALSLTWCSSSPSTPAADPGPVTCAAPPGVIAVDCAGTRPYSDFDCNSPLIDYDAASAGRVGCSVWFLTPYDQYCRTPGSDAGCCVMRCWCQDTNSATNQLTCEYPK